MDFIDLIKKTLNIAERDPWNDYNNTHSIIIEHQDNFYIIEFSNNKCNIYPNVNNVYVYEYAKLEFKKIPNIYQLEQYSTSLYNQLEYYSFEYTYPINIQNDVKRNYFKNNISLENNQKYISLLHKKPNGYITSLEEDYFDKFNQILDLIISFLDYMEYRKNKISEDRIMFFNNNKVDLIKSQLFLVMLEQRIHYNVLEYKVLKPKILKRRLIIDMRFLGPISKEDFKILFAAYDDSVGKLLTPLGMKEMNFKHLSLYLDSLFEKGIYKIIEVGNIELYHILTKMLAKYDCEITFSDSQDLFDCIYDDYERIILSNSRIEVKK